MANLSMKTGPKGLALIKEFEGCELKAYRDAVGIWTVGFGHTAAAGAPAPKAGMTIMAAEAEEILKRDLAKYEKAVCGAVKVPLTQEQFDALVSFTFNVGPANLRISTLLKKLNARDYAAVPEQLKRWNKAGKKVLKGLTRRREAEGFLWSTGAAPAVPQTPPDIEPIPVSTKPSLWARLVSWFSRPAKEA
jgi:lysozyme